MTKENEQQPEVAQTETAGIGSKSQRTLRAIAFLISLSILGGASWFLLRPSHVIVQGSVDSIRIDISARVNGRAAAQQVKRGQNVKANSEVFAVNNPEIHALLSSAKAAQTVAEAELARVLAGTRSEVIDQLKSAMESAQANKELAQKTYDRISLLAKSGFSPQSRLDQVTDALISSSHSFEQAQLAYEQAVAGFIKEDIEIAKANVAKAKADVTAAQVRVDELVIRAPIDGQVFRINTEEGEFVLEGAPLLSIADIEHPYIVLNLREDMLAGLTQKEIISFTVPALNKDIKARASFTSARGEYSSWTSTRTTGDLDLRTFEVRFVPIDKVEGLRPGMSVFTQWSR